jgi:hypothetical protein
MKLLNLIFLTTILLSSKYTFGQDQKILNEFYSKILQVKYADANVSKTGVDYIVSRGVKESQDLIAIKDFIHEKFGLTFVFTSENRNEAYSLSNSFCEIVNVSWKVGSFQSTIGAVGSYPLELIFTFCDGKEYIFNANINVNGYTYSLSNAIKRTLIKLFPEIELQTLENSLKIKNGEILLNESELNSFLANKIFANKNEGVYKIYSSTEQVSFDKIALFEKENKLYILNLENKYFKDDFKYGEIRGELSKTSVENVFFGKIKNVLKNDSDLTMSVTKDNLLEIKYTNGNTITFIKL